MKNNYEDFSHLIQEKYRVKGKTKMLKCAVEKSIIDCCNLFEFEEFPELFRACLLNDILVTMLGNQLNVEKVFRPKRTIDLGPVENDHASFIDYIDGIGHMIADNLPEQLRELTRERNLYDDYDNFENPNALEYYYDYVPGDSMSKEEKEIFQEHEPLTYPLPVDDLTGHVKDKELGKKKLDSQHIDNYSKSEKEKFNLDSKTEFNLKHSMNKYENPYVGNRAREDKTTLQKPEADAVYKGHGSAVSTNSWSVYPANNSHKEKEHTFPTTAKSEFELNHETVMEKVDQLGQLGIRKYFPLGTNETRKIIDDHGNQLNTSQSLNSTLNKTITEPNRFNITKPVDILNKNATSASVHDNLKAAYNENIVYLQNEEINEKTSTEKRHDRIDSAKHTDKNSKVPVENKTTTLQIAPQSIVSNSEQNDERTAKSKPGFPTGAVELQTSTQTMFTPPCMYPFGYPQFPNIYNSPYRVSADNTQIFKVVAENNTPKTTQLILNPAMYPYMQIPSMAPSYFPNYVQQANASPSPTIQVSGPGGQYYMCNPIPSPANNIASIPGIEVRQQTGKLQDIVQETSLTKER